MSPDRTIVTKRAPWQYFLVRLPSGRPPRELMSVFRNCFSAQSPLVAAQVKYLGTLATKWRWSVAEPHIAQLLAKYHSGMP